MKITIVIPAYNEENIIARCLESIASQSVQPDEIIVVDNNSTDKTVHIAKNFHATIIHEKRQGISFARNAGFNASTGDIIARIDADTILSPHWVRTIKQTYTNPNIVGITGPIFFSTFLGFKFLAPLLHGLQTLLYFKTAQWILGYTVMIGSNMAIRRETWNNLSQSVCLKDHLYHEDTDLSIHLHQKGSIVYNPQLAVTTSPRRFYNISSIIDYSRRHIRSILHGLKEARKMTTSQVKSPSHG